VAYRAIQEAVDRHKHEATIEVAALDALGDPCFIEVVTDITADKAEVDVQVEAVTAEELGRMTLLTPAIHTYYLQSGMR